MLELHYFRDQNVPQPEVANQFEDANYDDRTFDVARSFFFSEDERREVSFAPTREPPEEWEMPEYGISPFPASYGVIIENSGSSGQFEIELTYKDTLGYDLEEPSSKLESVDSDEQVEVLFDVMIPGDVEYEIFAEPA
ncbi:hypothetical protein CV102_16635 [Natronococcus pandeyae]|uniref:Uncharacterized protein n=2 Tax=Natronococcus pandeyae TaxID=2055836 RepID=A0A8J8PZ96_9EURY|nr:hypothetical protein CV102_16635 [Natronococcus pandeyae]